MNTNKNDVSALIEPGLNSLFIKHFNNYDKGQIYRKLATVVKSKSDSEEYSWLNDSPSVREFLGEREIRAISGSSYTLKNKTWETTLGVERCAFEDEKFGALQIRIEELAKNVSNHKNKLVIETIIQGNSNICLDGVNFFSTSHKYFGKSSYKQTQSNLNNLALTDTNLKTSISNMRKFVNSEGLPLNINPNILLVPTDLEWTAKEIVYSDHIGTSNSDNPLKNSLEVVVSPYITDADSWYLLDCREVLKPIILQERCNVEFKALGSDSEEGFMRDILLFGVRARYNAGYSLWQKAYANIP